MPRSKSPVARHVLTSKSAAKPAALPSTQIVHHQHNVEVERPGFFSNMWQGFGLGAGQAIAHNVFRSDPEVKVVHQHVGGSIPSGAASSAVLPKEYVQCLKDNSGDKDLCKQFLG
jgi:hypothetical protein